MSSVKRAAKLSVARFLAGLGTAVLVGIGAPPLRAEEAAAFTEAAQQLGIDFTHDHFGTGEKYMPENMGSGVAMFDYDGDGRLDLYFVQGAPLGPGARPSGAGNVLFRQRSDGLFEDVTDRASVGDTGYGMGASFGDIDGDGDLDLYVTNFGPNVLFRNEGDGTFFDVTGEAGVAGDSWSTASGFFDADSDGDLDLFVVNYVDFGFDNHKWCGSSERRIRSYCHPDVYGALPDVLYRNDGLGRFEEITEEAGVVGNDQAKGLGLAFGDFDGDGSSDIFVGNDSTLNFLYLGDGTGRFRDAGLLAGVAVNGTGTPEASMGVVHDDLTGDGLADLFLTHLDEESNTFYRNLGGGSFSDATARAGLEAVSRPWVGFGAVAIDHDADGDLDLFVANGHIIDNIELFDPSSRHRQPAQLFENDGKGEFVDVSGRLGLAVRLVGRGATAGDLDGDGDRELVITQNGGRAVVLRAKGESDRGLAVRLHTSGPDPRGLGVRLGLHATEQTMLRAIPGPSSYLSQAPPIAHFERVLPESTLIVTWPSGQTSRYHGARGGSTLHLFETVPIGNRSP